MYNIFCWIASLITKGRVTGRCRSKSTYCVSTLMSQNSYRHYITPPLRCSLETLKFKMLPQSPQNILIHPRIPKLGKKSLNLATLVRTRHAQKHLPDEDEWGSKEWNRNTPRRRMMMEKHNGNFKGEWSIDCVSMETADLSYRYRLLLVKWEGSVVGDIVGFNWVGDI